MGAKIDLCYLVSLDCAELLTKALAALNDEGWQYNQCIPGEYSYWLHGPIWEFGESRIAVEQQLGHTKDMRDVIGELSKYFSPTIVLGTKWFGKCLAGSLSLFENEHGGEWQELCIAVDWDDAIQSVNDEHKSQAIDMICRLFASVAVSVRPYFGLGTIEVGWFPLSPDEISVDASALADMYYFSDEAATQLDRSELKQHLTSCTLPTGLVMYRRRGLLELG